MSSFLNLSFDVFIGERFVEDVDDRENTFSAHA